MLINPTVSLRIFKWNDLLLTEIFGNKYRDQWKRSVVWMLSRSFIRNLCLMLSRIATFLICREKVHFKHYIFIYINLFLISTFRKWQIKFMRFMRGVDVGRLRKHLKKRHDNRHYKTILLFFFKRTCYSI